MAPYINENGSWNEEAIRRDFIAHEAEEIIRTEILREGVRDSRQWKHHPKGKYTVKTGYMRCMEVIENKASKLKPEGSKRNKKCWEELWSLKVPPKLKIFWWQLYWNILPTEGNLSRRQVPISPSCGLCGYSRASTLHAMFLCANVREVWREMAISLPKGADTESDPIDFLQCLIFHNNGVIMDLIVALAWGIWKIRCDILHCPGALKGSRRKIVASDVKWAVAMIEEFKAATGKVAREMGSRVSRGN